MANVPDLAKFPAELRELRRWVPWKYLRRGIKLTKKPLQSTTEPEGWLSDSEAGNSVARGEADGVGFVLGNGIVGIDLDGCIDENGELSEVARDAMGLCTYTERSPSGRGLHLWIRGEISRSRKVGARGGGPRREIYDGCSGHARFLTVTGDRVGNVTEIRSGAAAQVALDAFYAKWFPAFDDATTRNAVVEIANDAMDDDSVLRRMFSARDGLKSRRLFDGDYSDYPSQSEADLALCRKLRFYTRADAAQIDRLFRQSRLMRPKLDSRRGGQTYGEITIGKALAAGGPTYVPRAAPFDRDAARRRAATKWAKFQIWWTYALQGAGELAFRVVCAIAMHADKNGEAYPAIPTIALLCGVSERRVQTAIRTIRACGVMSIVPRAGTSNLYRLALRVPETITPYATRRRARGVMEAGTLGVTPVVPTNIPRTDQELDTGDRAANDLKNECAESDDDNLPAFHEPCIPLTPSARRLRDEMLRGKVGRLFLHEPAVPPELPFSPGPNDAAANF